jgi:multidrug transporter EmrE-like cation transporter
MGYLYISGTIFFTVYGQLIIKWRIGRYGQLPDGLPDKINFLFHVLLDPYILSGFAAAFIASFFWMAAMTKFDLSFAYPFMSLAFVLVLILSVMFFREPLTIHKVAGMFFIVTGIFISSRSL